MSSPFSLKPNKRTDFWLFGYPLSHSASPAFQNAIFSSLGLQNRYVNSEAKTPEDGELLKLIRSPTFGGAAVTMPLKVSIIPYLDSLSESAIVIGSVNTILVSAADPSHLTGENFDWLGVRNSLRRSLPHELQNLAHPFGEGKSGYIIGGGGTTRAAVYALSHLGISPIFLINRDRDETAQIIEAFPQYDLKALETDQDWTATLAEKCVAGVGAIPSFAPETDSEKMVYKIAEKIFEGRVEGETRFLEMCYKPRRTPLLEMAESKGWVCVQGIEAMCEQGLAQQHAWLLSSAACPFDPIPQSLGEDIQEAARNLVRRMDDIKDNN